MKSKNSLLASSITALVLPLALSVDAGTIITTNLPTGTEIVNIDARSDGAATYSPDANQAYWYQPFTGTTFASLTFQPGTYQFRIINPSDAASLYPSLTTTQLSEIYTAWTYNSPWTEDYLAYNATALADPTEFQLFDGAIAPGYPPGNTFSSAQAAYDGTIANGYYNQIRPAPPGRNGDASSYLTQYTFTIPTTVLFVIPDWYLPDNSGGVSVVVSASTASVPDTGSTLSMLLIGGVPLLGASFHLRRRSSC